MVSGDEIRVMDILPSTENHDINAPISCEIRVVSLSDRPRYETLSYVWGALKAHTTVKIIHENGAVAERGVTRNLYNALSRLRLRTRKRSVWADQLCINQWDDREKAQQVQLMRTIYSTCTRALLWMGEVPPEIPLADAEAAIDTLDYMARLNTVDNEDSVPVPAWVGARTAPHGPMEALTYICPGRCPWWTRLWTVQEAVLPPDALRVWGPLSLPWAKMDHFARDMADRGPPGRLGPLARAHEEQLQFLASHIIWLRAAHGDDGSLLYAIKVFRGRGATDPRDKLYGLLGLPAGQTMALSGRCDYTLSPAEVYAAATLDLILAERGLKPFTIDPRLEDKIASPGIPRWALDLVAECFHETDFHHFFGYDWYSANAGRELDLDAFRKMAGNSRGVLELQGMYVDKIEVVGELLLKESDDAQIIKTLKGWRQVQMQYNRTIRTKYLGSDPKLVFGLLVLGRLAEDQNQRVASDDESRMVFDFMATGERQPFHHTLHRQTMSQRFLMTKSGWMALGHVDSQVGDEVWVFRGGRVPFTVRPHRRDADGTDYDFVGRCYVQGIMEGEAWDLEGQVTYERTISLH